VAQFHWRPEEYLALMRSEVPEYERLQDEAVAATVGGPVARVLELGTGTGETARRALERHPEAFLVGVDASPEMLVQARSVLPAERVELRVGRLEDQLPDGAFDVLVSVLALHHLDGAGKADFFTRARAALAAGGLLVVGDVIVPEDPADAVTPIDGEYDKPSTVAEQLGWLRDAGFEASVAWSSRDLAVMVGRLSRS
jgi:cyclopropane fatty-acyl-phospholipid synthase-like methyltransferase